MSRTDFLWRTIVTLMRGCIPNSTLHTFQRKFYVLVFDISIWDCHYLVQWQWLCSCHVLILKDFDTIVTIDINYVSLSMLIIIPKLQGFKIESRYSFWEIHFLTECLRCISGLSPQVIGMSKLLSVFCCYYFTISNVLMEHPSIESYILHFLECRVREKCATS